LTASLEQDGKKVYFTAAVDGTKQLFEVNFPGMTKIVRVQQVTKGDFDVNDLVGLQQYYRKQRRYEPCFRNFFL
jgi:hypothetical protein